MKNLLAFLAILLIMFSFTNCKKIGTRYSYQLTTIKYLIENPDNKITSYFESKPFISKTKAEEEALFHYNKMKNIQEDEKDTYKYTIIVYEIYEKVFNKINHL
jgi:hypothetical protein